MKVCSVLFFLVLGLTAYDYTLSMPVELVDLEHMKTTIVDSTKAAEIIDNKESDVEDDSSDAENGEESEEDGSQKKEYVPETPDVSAVATEGEESPTKKESVLDSKKEESSEATVAKDCIDGLGKRHYGWGGGCGGGGGYGGYGGGYGGYGGGYGGHGGGYGGYGGHGHGEHGHHEHGHDNHDHGYEFYEEYDDHEGGHHGGHEGTHGGGHGGYGGYGHGGIGYGGHGHEHEGHEHGHHGHHAGYHREWNYNHAGEHGGHGGHHLGGYGCGGYGCHGGYKKEEIKAEDSIKKGKAKKNSKKSKEAGATKDKKAEKDAAKTAEKDAAKTATKDAAKAAEVANTQAVPKPGQQAQQLNWGNVQLATSNKQSTPALNPSEVMDKSQGGGVKNWWKVGDGCVHWGHDHWGGPHHLHPCGGGWEYGHTGMKHGHGYYRDEVPDCNDPETATTNKRCLHGGFGHHGGYGGYGIGGHGFGGHYGGHHGDGYHFVDHGSHHGHDGHHEQDFHLRGPWTFGYDDFGDDWGDWDHNYHNFHHLEHLEHPHDHAGHGKAEVPSAADKKYHLVPIEPFYGGWGFPARGYGYGLGRGYGYGYGIGPGVGYWPASYGIGVRHHGFGHHGVLNHFPLGGCIGGLYRDVIHKGSKKPTRRCLFGRIGHPLGGWYGWGSWPWGGYGDFAGHGSFGGDVGGGLYGNFYGIVPLIRGGRGFLYGKGAIPKGDKQEFASSRQGVVYPYVGYGPWASYPWWGDWWGGHGHHGWGSFGHGAHHGGIGYGRRAGYGHGVGLHCRDIVPNDDENDNENKGKSKRFCVPIGYHGGYGWPFWHGYPGAGLGMYGWGWPWYKSKVPKGEKGESSESKKAEKSNEKDGKKAGKDLKSTQRDEIPGPDHKPEKKQTIHVGYGYASGDNYRLGYGFGGMGGVSGFSGAAHGSSLSLDDGHAESAYKKSIMPSQKENSPLPENVKEVTATKRHFQEDCNENGPSGCAFTSDSHPSQEYGHPVTHPGFTTIGTPGIAVISKNMIPKATEKAKPAKRDFDGSQISGSSGYGGPSSFAQPVTQPGFTTVAWPGHALTTNDAKNRIPKITAKVKRQIFGPQEGFSGMVPMQDQVPDQPFPQEQGPEMMGPSRFSDQPSAAMMPAPSNGYPGFQRAFIPMAPRPVFAPELLNNDDSLPY